MSDEQVPEEQPRDRQPPPEPSGTPVSQIIGRTVIGVLVVLFIVFAIANAQPVDFSWIFGESRVQVDPSGERIGGGVPLIVLLVAAFLIGLLVGLVVAWQSERNRRRAAKQS